MSKKRGKTLGVRAHTPAPGTVTLTAAFYCKNGSLRTASTVLDADYFDKLMLVTLPSLAREVAAARVLQATSDAEPRHAPAGAQPLRSLIAVG